MPARAEWKVAAAVLALYAVFVGVRLAVFDGDPSGFVTAGTGITDTSQAPEGLWVTPGTDGYDGQAYYRIARDPLTDEVTADGITFARPAHWQTRIGYPVAAWALSAGGRAGLLPAALLGLNVVAVAAIALLGARVATRARHSPWWGALPALWPGFLVGVGQDLSEPLAGVLVMGGLVALRSQRAVLATVALTAAALTRETTLVVPAALAVVAALAPVVARLRSRQVRAPRWWVGVVPWGVYGPWRAWVHDRWSDVVPDPPSSAILEAPLLALSRYVSSAAAGPTEELANLFLLAPTLAVIVVAATAVLARGGAPHERLALTAYIALLACLPVWDRGQAYLRWACEPMLLAPLLLLGRRRLVLLAGLTLIAWVITATQSVAYPRSDGIWGGWWAW